MQNLLACVKKGVELKPTVLVNDRSAAQVSLAGPEEAAEEAERWRYFFASGCSSWFEDIKAHTFPSTFCSLTPIEARAIVDHWEARARTLAMHPAPSLEERGHEEEKQAEVEANTGRAGAGAGAEAEAVAVNKKTARAPALSSSCSAKLEELLETCLTELAGLEKRLDEAVASECANSSVDRCFVKLSTRSPKDSKKILAAAADAFNKRLAGAGGAGGSGGGAPQQGAKVSANDKWAMLSEEVTNASSVCSGRHALELLLDSDRVFEDLEYALRGPPVDSNGKNSRKNSSSSSSDLNSDIAKPPPLCWDMSLVARAWDSRVKPSSEFRGIAWGNELTCLCQYFHPLHFQELQNLDVLAAVERDCLSAFNQPDVKAAVAKLGGHCIIDFCWLGDGEPVIIVELNPFDGVCLGTFPASTGLFLWDTPDRAVMCGEAPFEFRVRREPLSASKLAGSGNREW
eukprot:CAMPEP_0171764994 /NCGR_PEP_ID=MMETSP0991-20121206/50349_1 /TAXON_ID=483369 /ORGANISM="non described non described, Strain CCMP2098" /LENGTH=457 /DNA_ID=CAMNT_0012369287 /DNA_START=33 /DNA_END=1403 /DNA_ORIENTATION=+